MQKVSGSPTVEALTGNDFPTIVRSVGYSVGALLDRPNIAMLKKVVDTPLLEMVIAVQLTNVVDAVNIDQRLNIQGHQVPIIAAQLVDQYPTESLEDFVLCFRRGATGFYGTIYNLDASVLNLWMKAYLEEKYTLIEAEHAKAKTEEQQAAAIDYKAYIERKEKERQEAIENPRVPDNWSTNELERFKLDYFNTTEYQQKKAMQAKVMRVASEFYANTDVNMASLKLWEDPVTGIEIPALNESDAIKIYQQAKEK